MVISLSLNPIRVRNNLFLVYDLPADILSTLTRKENGAQEHGKFGDHAPTEEPVLESKTESVVGSKACSLCNVQFHTVEEQRGHVRSDLHGYNLKQRIRGSNPVTENEFEKLVGGMIRIQFYEHV